MNNQWNFKKSVVQLVVIAFVLLMLPTAALASFSVGDGTEGNPYQISTAEELNSVRNYLGNEHADKHFKLIENIDLTDTVWGAVYARQYDTGGWEPIGSLSELFRGNFDGDGYTITGLFIDRPGEGDVGLFGSMYGALQNVGLSGVNVTGKSTVGGLAGTNYGAITGSYVTGGTVSGSGDVIGGLTGRNGTTISDSYAQVTVAGSVYQFVGGLAGVNAGTISNSHAEGGVQGAEFVGGLVGSSLPSGMIENAYATGLVTGSGWYIGGLAGKNDGTVSNSHATGNVTGTSNVGGLVGENGLSAGGTIENSYATGNVDASSSRVGGLVGWMYHADSTITGSYATGNVSGRQRTGGLVGQVYEGTVNNSYALNTGISRGSGSASTTFGRIAGENSGTLSGNWANSTMAVPFEGAYTEKTHDGKDGADLDDWSINNGILMVDSSTILTSDPVSPEMNQNFTFTVQVRDVGNNPVNGLDAGDFDINENGTGSLTLMSVEEDGTTGKYTVTASYDTAETITITVYVLLVQAGSIENLVIQEAIQDVTPSEATSGITNQAMGEAGNKKVSLTIAVKNASSESLTGYTAADFSVSVDGASAVTFENAPFSNFQDNNNGFYLVVFTGDDHATDYTLTSLTVDGVEIEAGPTTVTTPPAEPVDITPAEATSGITNQAMGEAGNKKVSLTIAVKNAAGEGLTGYTAADFSVLVEGAAAVTFENASFSNFQDNNNGFYLVVFTGNADAADYVFTDLTVDSVVIEAGPTTVTTPEAGAEAPSADEAIALDREALTWDSIKGANSTQDSVTVSLVNPLPTAGANGTSITWSTDPAGWVNTSTGAVIRPSYTAGDKTATLTATISKDGGTDQTKSFTLTIKAKASTGSGGGSSRTAVDKPETGISKTIYPASGGTLEYEDIIITVPEAALPANATFSINKLNNKETNEAVSEGLRLKLGSDVYEITTTGSTEFGDQAISIKIAYNPENIAEGEQPVINYYDEEAGQWVAIETTIEYDQETGTYYAVITVNHLTKFAVFSTLVFSSEADKKTITLVIGSTIADIDGSPYTLDAVPQIDSATSRTLVPIRFVSEALGADVEWIKETNQVKIVEDSKEIILTIGSTSVIVYGNQNTIDCAPVVMAPGRTFVPLRFISETLGAEVDYEDTTKQIVIKR